jgi:hypothetical protein
MAMKAEVTMAMATEDIISVAAITTTAMVARITRHTDGRTPAPTEWWVDSEAAGARLRNLKGLTWRTAER